MINTVILFKEKKKEQIFYANLLVGAPLLGCAQPSCVAGPGNLGDASDFPVNVEGQIDGFLREGDKDLKRYRDPSAVRLVAVSQFGIIA